MLGKKPIAPQKASKVTKSLSIAVTCMMAPMWGGGTALADVGAPVSRNVLNYSSNTPLVRDITQFNTTEASEGRKPNIIYILADDLGYGDLGFLGQKEIKTPVIDSMAAEGMFFSQHYTGAPVCAPSRACLMTGMHVGHSAVRGNDQAPLSPSDTTVAEVLQDNGYTTGLIGKWGIGENGTTGAPNKQGFDYFFGYTDQLLAHNYYPSFLWRNTEKVTLNNKYSHDLFTEEALNFVDQNKEEPFFLYLAYTIPHSNMQVPDYGIYADKSWSNAEKAFASMVTRMDTDIGRLENKLEELGIDDDTLIVFTSDNGAHSEGGHSADTFDSNGIYRGIKRDLYEGGIHTPLVAKWPEKIQPGTTTNHVSAFWDFLPTVCEVAGIKSPEGIDGISYLPTLLGEGEQQKHDRLYWYFNEGQRREAVRIGDWKGVRYGTNPIELYDLKTNPQETAAQNLAAQRPEVVTQIAQIMQEEYVPLVTINLNKSAMALTAGKTETLTAAVGPSDLVNKSVVWSSSDETVAVVDATGKVTAIGEGQATIMATTVETNRAAICNVTVSSYITINDSIKGTGLKQFEFYPTASWTSNTQTGTYNGDSTFSNNYRTNTDYMKFRFEGQQVKLYGNVANNHGIAAISIDGGPEIDVDYYANVRTNGKLIYTSPMLAYGEHILKVRVKKEKNPASGDYAINIDRVDLLERVSQITGVSIDKDSINLEIGDMSTLTATVTPANATNKAVTWTSSDNTIATVTGGVVKAVKAGTATITVTTADRSLTDTCKVTIKDPAAVETLLSLETGAGTVGMGQSFDVVVKANAAAYLAGLDLSIPYNGELFEVESVGMTEGFGTSGKTAFLAAENKNGVLRIVAVQLGQRNISGDAELITIRFKSKNIEGAGEITLKAESRVANPSGQMVTLGKDVTIVVNNK